MDPVRVAGTLWNVLYYLAGAVSRFLRPGPFNITSHDLLQESMAERGFGGDAHTAGVCQDQSDEVAREPSAPLPARAGEKTQNAATEGEENLPADHRPTDEQTSDVNGEDDAPTRATEMDAATIAVHLNHRADGSERQIKSTNVNGRSDAVTGERVGADEDASEEEAEAEPAREIGEAFANLPSRECDAEPFARGNKTQVFLPVEKSEENPTRRDSREEAAGRPKGPAGETEATRATSKTGVQLPEGESAASDAEDLQGGAEALASETGWGPLGFSRDEERMGAGGGLGGCSLKPESCAVREQRSEEVTKYAKDPLVSKVKRGLNETPTARDLRTTRTEETTLCSDGRRREALLDTSARPEGHFDSKQDDFSNESRYDAESFSIISSPESGFSDRSFGESRAAAFALEQEVLEMKSLEIPKSDSEEEAASFSGEQTIAPSADEPECQLEPSGSLLNFAPQRSRMAVKNPRVRPPKDRRSLLQRPSAPAASSPPPQPPSKIPVGVHVLGGFRLGIQLPGLGAAFPVAKKLPPMGSENSAGSRAPHRQEAELKAAPKADAAKQAGGPPGPKWMPPRQAGLGNPFMSELKTKLKKATKN
ncbi:histone acetyltransferase KAT6A [Hippocampus zosterae]|uniref:histone acetyltransferase KAT6A n=1 Tax=Hippocampus zosterae TaxID=109293 RepID=UPI00223D3EB6|nr:histone acetyltransferase KAT6A [Hippocampus zosterae]